MKSKTRYCFSYGFSLVELLVVIAIIAILATIAITSYNNYTEASEKNTVLVNYSRLVSFAEAELYKCKVDKSGTYVDSNQPCSSLTASNAVTAIQSYIAANIKNPYTGNAAAGTFIVGSSDCVSDFGHYGVISSGDSVSILTCTDSNASSLQSTTFTI